MAESELPRDVAFRFFLELERHFWKTKAIMAGAAAVLESEDDKNSSLHLIDMAKDSVDEAWEIVAEMQTAYETALKQPEALQLAAKGPTTKKKGK